MDNLKLKSRKGGNIDGGQHEGQFCGSMRKLINKWGETFVKENYPDKFARYKNILGIRGSGKPAEKPRELSL